MTDDVRSNTPAKRQMSRAAGVCEVQVSVLESQKNFPSGSSSIAELQMADKHIKSRESFLKKIKRNRQKYLRKIQNLQG